MPLYAGETVRLKSTVASYDGVALTPTQVTLAEVAIFDATGTEVVRSNLTWDATRLYWYYDWTTIAGTYRAKAHFAGVNFASWNYHTLRVKADPLTIV